MKWLSQDIYTSVFNDQPLQTGAQDWFSGHKLEILDTSFWP